MKKFGVLLILMGGCIVFLIIGFSLGQLTSVATSQGIRIETKSMKIMVTFKPEASDLMKDIGAASLRFYSEVLTVCLNESENLEKINSTRVLANFVAGSCFVNALRPRIKEREKNLDKKGFDGKYAL